MLINFIITVLILWKGILFIPLSDTFFTKETTEVVVRESTIDLQIRVEDKIFVFTKANGGLEKVKVGMHVLELSQVQEIVGVNSEYQKFSWKRLPDGSIQVSSFYSPWPNQLRWTILPSGLLKLSVEGQIPEQYPIGLAFNLPEKQLVESSWSGSDFGNWSASSNSGDQRIVNIFAFNQLKLNFDKVKLTIQASEAGISMKWNASNNVDDFRTKENKELSFLLEDSYGRDQTETGSLEKRGQSLSLTFEFSN